ncbi:MAG TPA: hypothetical protein VG347_22475, partial [Verrucomicrobiae bacterium]|nr:hypothetical protein [Verrucomicrobiae bacterium]
VSGIGGLWAAVFAIRKDAKSRKEEAKARKISNLVAITANHRELWKEYSNHPEYKRVLDPNANLDEQPITSAEETFMSMWISQTSSTYEALKDDLLTKLEGFKRDVGQSFSLPIPNAVWQRTKLLQNQDFAAFIESSLK